MTPDHTNENKRPLLIAIDGPVGAGKSSISDAVADRLGILHLDTGAMYRACGLECLRCGISTKDEQAVSALIAHTDIDVRYEDGRQKTLLKGQDVSADIRTPAVADAASDVSCFQKVRARMVALQQELASRTSMLLDGRDIGTVVLKDAPVKIFLTASVEARAKRRLLDYQKAGRKTTLEEVLKAVNERDYQDTHREADPLRKAEDAVVVDSSDLSFDETVSRILAIVAEKTEGAEK